MIIQNDEELYYCTFYNNWLSDNWLDHKERLRKASMVVYTTKLFIREMGMNEEDYPMEWD